VPLTAAFVAFDPGTIGGRRSPGRRDGTKLQPRGAAVPIGFAVFDSGTSTPEFLISPTTAWRGSRRDVGRKN